MLFDLWERYRRIILTLSVLILSALSFLFYAEPHEETPMLPTEMQEIALADDPPVIAQHTSSESTSPSSYPTDTPININTATTEELDTLPGIGPTRANAIIAYRTQHGPFEKPEDLCNVSGIGKKTFAKLQSKIRIK